jgi:hypothetical protein
MSRRAFIPSMGEVLGEESLWEYPLIKGKLGVFLGKREK